MPELLEMRRERIKISSRLSKGVADYCADLVMATNPFLPEIEQFKTANGRPFRKFLRSGGGHRAVMDLAVVAAAFAQALGDKDVHKEHVKAVFPPVARAHMSMVSAASIGNNPVKKDDLIDLVLARTQP
jgi:MoxR-like ATPase